MHKTDHAAANGERRLAIVITRTHSEPIALDAKHDYRPPTFDSALVAQYGVANGHFVPELGRDVLGRV
jgi:hypothetical protein